MENKIFLTVAIPTYNNAGCLENLLNNILPQVEKSQERVQVCISNNGSKDNTRNVAMAFSNKYPGLIKYNENKENLGVDTNVIKVLEMSDGDFVWTFGDDDLMAKNGLSEVFEFIKKINKEKIGLILARTESYFFDKKTGQKIIERSTLDKSRPETFKINKEEVIGITFPDLGFLSALIYNNKLVHEILREDKPIIELGIRTNHVHMLFFHLMFLKYPHIDAIVMNKDVLVYQESARFKFFVEDKFLFHYQVHKKLNKLLLSYKYMNDGYAPLIIKRDKVLRREFIIDMIILKTFGGFNCFSYFGCLKLFFQKAVFIDALSFSLVFSILFLIPSVFLRFLYRALLMVKYGKEWNKKWIITRDKCSVIYSGTRRRNDMAD